MIKWLKKEMIMMNDENVKNEIMLYIWNKMIKIRIKQIKIKINNENLMNTIIEMMKKW